ncbi:MAG: winged helix-turn-helix domain-containing protein [Terracidiphilus sp.]|jgi:DNA-binding winged helix-turn-helix (wHTH) protein/tetratricopeptide (TPR) repeat protein
MPPALHDAYRFDEFELSRPRRTLLRNGQAVSLLPKTFEVLSYLVENPGRVVSKEELLKTAWPESFVEENNLTQHISLLRKALGDRAGFIVTIPGRGYQFTAQVASGDVPPQPSPSEGPGATGAGEGEPGNVPPSVLSLAVHGVPLWVKATAAAVVLCAAALTGYWGYATWKHLVHPPQLRRVIVADFLNSTGDATFDHTLKEALEIDLEQSPYIDVMSEREAAHSLELMGRAQGSAITPEVAREICERSNRQVMLTGSILPLGRDYLLTVEATDCGNGSQIAGAKAEAGAKERVLAALDTIADKVRRGLGETPRSIENYQVPIMQATTASLDALRSYSIGQSMDAEGKSETETIPFYQRAVELDPNFAMAYGAMANEYYNLSEPKVASQFYKKAFDLSGQVSAKEKLILEAHYYSEGEQDMEHGINTYRQWTETYPSDWVPWIDLANDYTQIGQYGPAIDAGQQAIKLEPNRAINSSVLARALMRANRFDEARSVGREAILRGIDSSGLHATLYELAAISHDSKALAEETHWAAAHNSGWYGWYFPFIEGVAAEGVGKNRFAEQLFHSSWEAAERENLEEAANDILIYQASVEMTYGLPAAARATLAITPNSNQDSPDLAIIEARLGDLTAANKFIAAHGPDTHPGTLMANVDLPRVRARLALARGNALDAIAALEPTVPFEMFSYTVPSERAEAWMAANRPDMAVSEYRKILTNQGIDGLSPLYSLAHLGMARAWSRQNKIAESRTEYEHFFAAWKDADADLPMLKLAHAEYAKLPKTTAVAAK